MYSWYSVGYSYTIALSGLFELYTRGGHLNHEANAEWFKAASVYNQINQDKATV